MSKSDATQSLCKPKNGITAYPIPAKTCPSPALVGLYLTSLPSNPLNTRGSPCVFAATSHPFEII